MSPRREHEHKHHGPKRGGNLDGTAGLGEVLSIPRINETLAKLDSAIKRGRELNRELGKNRKKKICCCGRRNCGVGPFTKEIEV